jgi:hypothetical protein
MTKFYGENFSFYDQIFATKLPFCISDSLFRFITYAVSAPSFSFYFSPIWRAISNVMQFLLLLLFLKHLPFFFQNVKTSCFVVIASFKVFILSLFDNKRIAIFFKNHGTKRAKFLIIWSICSFYQNVSKIISWIHIFACTWGRKRGRGLKFGDVILLTAVIKWRKYERNSNWLLHPLYFLWFRCFVWLENCVLSNTANLAPWFLLTKLVVDDCKGDSTKQNIVYFSPRKMERNVNPSGLRSEHVFLMTKNCSLIT